MKKGFTLLEMLVVIGIIVILSAATLSGYMHVLRAGERARAQELVMNVATAMTACFNREGVWPEIIRSKGAKGDVLDEKVAYCLKNDFSLTVDDSSETTTGYDRFGIVTPWANDVVKRLGSQAKESTPVSGGKSIKDHQLHFAVDLNGDGLIENVSVGGVSISVRATAIVWCCNQKGEIPSYTVGVKKGGIYSWTYGQTLNVK